jgi:hypothetical protein
MQNSDFLSGQIARLECIKLLSGHISIDCHINPQSSFPVENQVLSNLDTLFRHSDALFRYVMAGDPMIKYVSGVDKVE